MTTHSLTRKQKRRTRTNEEAADSVQPVAGLLELHPQGYGFLRQPPHFDRRETDPHVPAALIAQFRLRAGNWLEAEAAAQPNNRRGPRVRSPKTIEGSAPREAAFLPLEQRTPVHPHRRLRLECGQEKMTARVLDLLAPLGCGQRALVVAPPRGGKTMLLSEISRGIASNHPQVHQVVLLVDERPEEVTEMRRTTGAEVFASSLDKKERDHIRMAQLAVERCGRLAERGRDVLLLVDSLTRLARANNKLAGEGPILTGGLRVRALDLPRQLFAAARDFEEGGSLTIVATALVETDSKMDDIIFQEFKGSGNSEIVLNRALAEQRIWPAVSLKETTTRREELLYNSHELAAVTSLRRALARFDKKDAMQRLTEELRRHATNADFLSRIGAAR